MAAFSCLKPRNVELTRLFIRLIMRMNFSTNVLHQDIKGEGGSHDTFHNDELSEFSLRR